MIKWFLRLLGFKGSLQRKKLKLQVLQEKAFNAQRNGNLRLAGKFLTEAEFLETEIIDEEKTQEDEDK